MTMVDSTSPNLWRGRFVYTDEDKQAVVDFVAEHGVNYKPEDVQALLQIRTGYDITISGAKNLLTKLRGEGRIPNKKPSHPNAGGRKKKAKPVAASPAPKVKKVKKFDPGMTADDLFDFNVQCIYAAQDTMPVAHLGPLNQFRKACEELMEALTR